MTNAIAGVGTVFQRYNGAIWQDIAEIVSIEGPDMDKEAIEVTSLDTEGEYDEFITGFMEGGRLIMNMNFTRNGFELMKSDFDIDVSRHYRIVMPDEDETVLEFSGLVIEMPLTMEADNQLIADVTIQITESVTISATVPDESVDISSAEIDADLEAYIDAISGTELSDVWISRLNTFITTIKSGLGITNLSDAFDVMYVLAGETEESSLLNLAKRAHDAQVYGTVPFTQYEGFTGGATTSDRLITNYVPSTDTVKFTLNDGAWGLYSRTDVAIKSGTAVGSAPYGGVFFMSDTTSTISRAGVNSGRDNSDYNVTTNLANKLGMFILNRVLSTEYKIYQNKSVKATSAKAADALCSYGISMLAYKETTTYKSVSTGSQFSFFFISRGLSETEIGVISDAFEVLMDSNGKGVVPSA